MAVIMLKIVNIFVRTLILNITYTKLVQISVQNGMSFLSTIPFSVEQGY